MQNFKMSESYYDLIWTEYKISDVENIILYEFFFFVVVVHFLYDVGLYSDLFCFKNV